MKLTKTKNQVTVVKEMAGLFTAKFEHEIKSTRATCDWTGPSIPPEQWHQVLSFFRWAYDSTKSEVQVRLFCNRLTHTWSAWAFPQKAGTGMTAEELDTDESKAQRAVFKESEGWEYLGTVHHHCSAGAFQSGTDESNEKSQVGLHITVGKIDEALHDIHCRFYIAQECFEPDMSLFWDVGDQVRELLPPDSWDHAARWQMCKHAQVEFPELWKQNLIAIKREIPVFTPGQGYEYKGAYRPSVTGPGVWQAEGVSQPIYVRAKAAVRALCKAFGNVELAGEWIEENYPDPDLNEVLRILDVYKIDLAELWREFPASGSWAELQLELDAQEREGKESKLEQGNGQNSYLDGWGSMME